MQLNDGTIIPSHLGVTNTSMGVSHNSAIGNAALRLGEVKQIIYPSDPKSRSKQFLEYVVQVQYLDESGVGATTDYHGCFVGSLFGGVADSVSYTLRPTPKFDKNGLGTGSKVLILCVNGQTSNAVIIGGVRDGSHDTSPAASKADGHNYRWIFNGVEVTVNDGGELTTTFKGATKADGTLRDDADASASGTTLEMTKDGSASLQHDGQFVTLDFPNKGLNLGADQTVNITGAKIKVGGPAAVDSIVKGTTYRMAEQTMHQAQLAALSSAMSALSAATAAIGMAATTMTAISSFPSPLSPLAPVGASLAAAVPSLAAVSAALEALSTSISTFEAANGTFLSQKHTVE